MTLTQRPIVVRRIRDRLHEKLNHILGAKLLAASALHV